mgnify:CR=1 FL=1
MYTSSYDNPGQQPESSLANTPEKPGPLRPPCNDKEPLSGRDFRRPDLPPRSCGIDRKRAQKRSEKQIPSQNHHTRRKDKSRQKRQEHPQQFKHGSIIIEVVHNTEFSVRFNKSFRPGRKHIEHARKHEGNDQRNAHHRNKQRPQKISAQTLHRTRR